MDKTARKPSNDPVQERLRQNKAAWNKEVSSFINDVIHFKKLMNGWPNKYFKERSKITLPIPSDPAAIMTDLAGTFQELAQRGNAIVQEQINYSKNRKLPRPQQATQTLNKLDEKYGPTETAVPPPLTPTPAAPPTATDLTKQLSASFEEKYGLIAESSNPFTRFLARLRTPQVGFGASAQVRRLRMDLLKSALRAYRSLGKLQVQITKSSAASIQEAHKMMQAAWQEWAVVSRNFNNYVNSLPDQTAPRPEEMREEGYSPEKEERELVQPAQPSVPVLSPPVSPEVIPPEKAMEDQKKKKEQHSVYPPLKGTEPPPPELETVAQAFLRKWLGKTRHQILPGRSSGIRLQVYQLAVQARKNIDGVMNLLETGMSIGDLGSKISEVSRQVNMLRSLMRSLASTEKIPKGQEPPTMGLF